MTLFLQQVINGIAIGSLYAIFAMGFGLVFATMNVLSLAHGSLATWGAIAAIVLTTGFGLSLWVAIPIALIFAGLLGALIDQFGFEPVRKRGSRESFFGLLISSIGIWIILENLALILTRGLIISFPIGAFPEYFPHIGGLIVSSTQIAIVVAAVVLVIVLHQLMHRSRVGAAIRAVGWNAKSAELSGINPRRMILAASALAAGVVAVSGIFFSITNNGLEFTLGDSLLLKGFAAVVVGGFGYVRGAMLGGVLIGVSEALGSQYVSSSFRDAIGFTLLILFLFVRPRGILGTAELSENA